MGVQQRRQRGDRSDPLGDRQPPRVARPTCSRRSSSRRFREAHATGHKTRRRIFLDPSTSRDRQLTWTMAVDGTRVLPAVARRPRRATPTTSRRRTPLAVATAISGRYDRRARHSGRGTDSAASPARDSQHRIVLSEDCNSSAHPRRGARADDRRVYARRCRAIASTASPRDTSGVAAVVGHMCWRASGSGEAERVRDVTDVPSFLPARSGGTVGAHGVVVFHS